MFYSQYLKIQEQYALQRQKTLPPFTIMLTAAFSVHLLFLLVMAVLPAAEAPATPFNVLHLKLGSPMGMADVTAGSQWTPPALAPSPITPPVQKVTPPVQRQAQPLKKIPATPRQTVQATRVPPKKLSAMSPASGGQPQRTTSQSAGIAPGQGVARGNPLGNASHGEEVARRYEQLLSAWLEQHKIYPLEAQQRGIEGRVILRVRINRAGQMQYVSIEKSSGNPQLDTAVIQTARASNPVPAVPMDYPGGDLLEFRIPIEFRLM